MLFSNIQEFKAIRNFDDLIFFFKKKKRYKCLFSVSFLLEKLERNKQGLLNQSDDVFIEKHHIIPKHMGVTDADFNMISLTYDEHTGAHQLLYETFDNKNDALVGQYRSALSDSERNKLFQGRSYTKGNYSKLATEQGTSWLNKNGYRLTIKPNQCSGVGEIIKILANTPEGW